MYKKSLTTLAILSSSVALFATDHIVSSANVFSGFPDSKDDVSVFYTGPAGTGEAAKARLGEANVNRYYNVKSITFKGAGETAPGTSTTTNDPSYWNTLGNYNIDIATADGEYYALKNESQGYISHQMGAITIKNSVKGSTATAIIDGGNRPFVFNGGGNIDQTPTLNIQTNTKLTTTSTGLQALYFHNATRLNVTNNSTFTIDATTRIGNTASGGAYADIQPPIIYVEKGSTLITNKAVSIESDTNLTVDGKWTIYGATTFKNTVKSQISAIDLMAGEIKVLENTSVYVRSFFHGTGNTLTVAGTFETGSATNFAQTVISNGGVVKQTSGDSSTLQRTLTVNNGGTFSTCGNLQISGGKTTDPSARWAKITIEKGAKFYVDGTTQWGTSVVLDNGELVLKQENAMTTSTGEFLTVTGTIDSTGAIMRIEADQTFKKITADTKNIDIYLSTTAEAILTSDFSVKNGAKIVIHDFAEDRICVGNEIQNPNNVFEAYQTINGEEVKIQNLFINNGWLSAVAVPEPAEWAMILGGIALALAIYRRKK